MISPVSRPVQSDTTAASSKPHDKATAHATGLSKAQDAVTHSPQGQKNQLNAHILQASLDVSISSGNNSMALLYRTAIDNINEQLAPELGPNALQAAMQQDNSPEATADRIVSMSTAFFDGYARQHPNKPPEDVARDFVDIIRGGFEKGYNEAASILKGLGVLEESGTIATEIGKTFALVQQGYDDFLESKLQALQLPSSDKTQD